MKYVLYFAFVCCVVFSGCATKQESVERLGRDEKAVSFSTEGQELTRDPLFMVDELVMSGDNKAALQLLEDIIGEEQYESERSWLFHKQLMLIAEMDGLAAAQEKYLEAFDIEDNEELVHGGFEAIYSLLNESEDWDAVLAWSERVSEFALPEDLDDRVFQWKMRALQEQGDVDSLLAMVPVCMEAFEPDASIRLLSGVIRSVIASDDYDLAVRILDVIAENSGEDTAFAVMVGVTRIEICFLAGQWDEGAKLFKELSPNIPDMELRTCFSRITRIISAADKPALSNDIAAFIIENLSDKPETRNRAAFQFLSVTSKEGEVLDVIAGLRKIISHDFPPQTVVTLCSVHFYSVIRDGSKEEHLEMLSVCEEILPMLEDEKQIGQMKLVIFDGAFVVGDYERAEKILESGVPEREPGWEDMALNKLKAHKALDEGNTEEAVKRFRKFMEYVESDWKEPVHNPLTGMLYTKNMSLGFNAGRIGDILASAEDTDAAGEAYGEAINYYTQALAEIPENSEEYEHVKKLISEIQAKSGG